MDATVAQTGTEGKSWGGGNRPLNASYGKLMMWFFIVSDALTFSGFIASYGFSRFKFIDAWPVADQVFTHVPFLTWRTRSNVLRCVYDLYTYLFFGDHGIGCRCRTANCRRIR